MIMIIFIVVIILIIYFAKANNKNNSKTVNNKFAESVSLNNADDLYEMGHKFYYGINIERNFNKAVYYLKRAAELNNENAKYLYSIMYYNLGENYGTNRVFAENCIQDIVNKFDDIKYIMAEIIYNSLIKKEPSLFTKDANSNQELLMLCLVGLMHCCDCFAASKMPQSRSKYGEKAKELIKLFRAMSEITICEIKDENGNRINTDEEAEQKVNDFILEQFKKYPNTDFLLREIGF